MQLLSVWGLTENDGKMKMNNRFGKRIFYLLAIIMGILLSLSSAKADEWTRYGEVEVAIDLTHPRSVPVWENLHFEGILPVTKKSVGTYLGLVCDYESDTTFGACSTKLSWAARASNVKLRFTNLKTKATVDLTVTGEWRTTCDSPPLNSGFTGIVSACGCANAIEFSTRLPETELRKLPSGGVWTARMLLRTMAWQNTLLGEIVTKIKLNVQSEAGISIPNPTVKLPVTMTWHSGPEPVTVDTCLFDGTGAGESSQYTLRLDDDSGAAKGDLFALKNVTKPDARPLYYTVSAGTPGTGGDKMLWTPGMQKVFLGMDEVPTTGTMTIRGKTVPCVRWPLTLKLQPFNPARQAMGQYQGQINLVFTPSLNMP
ncbi:CfaE/CblD family pilus tip adhesin [Yersinia kristensenii]|uniref:CfaE/CblD family pilus tip adhesin n=2 Tax=Yersinia kristensenii TaxID=28152 RepID=UPI0005EA605E|nr:Colonization factor antigen I subunit E [Yersinia kristensenii]CNK67643.1 Colonization factor antigen I subunit E [Yersinia kristensenii]